MRGKTIITNYALKINQQAQSISLNKNAITLIKKQGLVDKEKINQATSSLLNCITLTKEVETRLRDQGQVITVKSRAI